MLETLLAAVFGTAYVVESKKEAKEERLENERKAKEETLLDIKTKIFCYAVRHGVTYNEVVKQLKDRNLIHPWEIEQWLKENE